ncbi:hypothetical protein PHJA_001445100 [Phtheirospermum japonicum]|uniref:Glycosyl transferase CAP10 domain-containing protein n=1 Tax=Phtheirospermum japonicum TaxID=374723 RepID=A0A830C7L4_9LAMI|nr:hypothetical protein PHJA_001445100 [Phtheirospermum japonicum]
MVEKARSTAHFRLTILDGKVYVERLRPSIQTRALFTMWGIVQMMRWYPGKLPDLELMFDCDDRPVVQSKNFRHPDSEPPPLFRYCSDWQSLDIVFPDWSFWGWAEINIKPWRSVLREIKEGNEKTKWEDRAPYAYWKGNPNVCPWRADLMKCNVTAHNDWNARLYVQDWVAESQKGYKQSNLGDQCTHRYKIYIEGWAWSAKAIGEAGSGFVHEDMKMEYVYDYMFHLLNEYSKLLNYKPTIPPNAMELCSESMACSADGIWRKFMEESLEKSPSDSVPCTLRPPYEPQELKAFVEEKAKATKEVEAWENGYWAKRNEKH